MISNESQNSPDDRNICVEDLEKNSALSNETPLPGSKVLD
jgi:hypothetical protein